MVKTALVVLLVCAAGAVVVGIVSRTPAEVRTDRPGRNATDPALGATFTDEQVARHGAYRGPAYLSFVIGAIVPLVLLVLLARGPFAGFVDRVEALRGGWLVHALVLGAILAVLTSVVLLPLGLARLQVNRAWGLSTQDLAGWTGDQAKALLVGAVIAAGAAAAFFGVVRAAPRTWWLWGWAAFTVLTVVLVFLHPIVISPLFNRFTSLEPGPLRERVLALGDEAGVPLNDVLVADASRRTTAENAYVTGLGATRRVVLYDTLLAAGDDDEVFHVVAHELAHRRERHVLKGVLLASAGLFLGFAVLYWLSLRPEPWAWSGARGIGDPRALPVLLIFLATANLVLTPVQMGLSRRMEGDADRIALELTGDPAPAVRSFRRLAFANLSDLRPPRAVIWLLYSHPPITERIRAALAAAPRVPER